MQYLGNIFKSKKSYYIGILILFLFAAFSRLYGVITKSFPFTYDIGRDLIEAREIATLQDLTLIGPTTGVEGLFYGPTWYYILALVYHPLFGSPTLITGFIVLTGLVAVIIAYFLGVKISGKFFAFSWAGLLAFSPAVMRLTSQIWSPHLIPIFWILSFVALYNIFTKKRLALNFFVLGVLCSVIVDMEIVVGLLYSAGIALGLIIINRKLLTIKNIALGILGFIVVLLPRIIFDIRHEFLLSKSFFNAVSDLIFREGAEQSVTPLSQKLYILFRMWADTIALGNTLLAAVSLIIILLLTFIFYRYSKSKLKYFLTLTLTVIFVSGIGILLLGHDIWSHYLVIFPLLFVTWVSIILAIGFSLKKYKYIFAVIAVLLILFNMNIPQKIDTYTSSLWEGDASTYRNQIDVLDYVYERAGDRPFKYIVYTPAVHDYPYRYLFNWYGEYRYNKLPDEENAKLLFVVLEPDHQDPQRRKAWLEVREDDGEIVEEVKLDGEITVQTRILEE